MKCNKCKKNTNFDEMCPRCWNNELHYFASSKAMAIETKWFEHIDRNDWFEIGYDHSIVIIRAET